MPYTSSLCLFTTQTRKKMHISEKDKAAQKKRKEGGETERKKQSSRRLRWGDQSGAQGFQRK